MERRQEARVLPVQRRRPRLEEVEGGAARQNGGATHGWGNDAE